MIGYVLVFLLGLLTRHFYEILWTRFRCPQCYRPWSLDYFSELSYDSNLMTSKLFEDRSCRQCGLVQSRVRWPGYKPPTKWG